MRDMERWMKEVRTILRSDLELELLRLFIREQPVVGTIPASVLWIGMWVVWQPADALVSADRRQVPSFGVDDVVYFLKVSTVIWKEGEGKGQVGRNSAAPCRMRA